MRRATAVDFFIDGEESFAAIAAAVEAARRSVFVTCCFGDLNFRLRPPAQEQLLDLCARTARRGVKVALLFWQSYATQEGPANDGTITLSAWKQLQAKAPGVVARWDASRGQFGGAFPSAGCQHQKAWVIDESIAFVGGINLTQDYWDTTAHAADDERRVSYDLTDPGRRKQRARLESSLPLHDVYCRFDGPAVADVAANFAERWNGATYKTAGTPAISVAPAGKDPASATRIQVLRTIYPNQYPRTQGGDFGIKDAMLRLIGSARTGIYLENQYFFHDGVIGALRAAVERGVPVVGLLTRRPDAGSVSGFGADVLGQRAQSKLLLDPYAKMARLGLYCPFTTGAAGLKDIYVHSKTMIVDDRFVLLGSANISTTSLEHHSELDVLVDDPARAKALRSRLWCEHLQLKPQGLPADFDTGARLWMAHADDNLTRLRQHKPARSRVLPLREMAGGSELGGESLTQRLNDDGSSLRRVMEKPSDDNDEF
jgi:phosphatidylserine/phosphatidylglycerophosphate/cardiolipin synthase-like enzyme